MHEDTFKGSGNLCEREPKPTPHSLPAPRQKHLVAGRSCFNSFSPGTIWQRHFLSFQGRCARQTWGGSSTSPFYTWGFWATDLLKVIWGVCAKPGIYYPLPKSQADAKYSWVVCWMPQPDSWKVLLHCQWVPHFRMHLFLNCTDMEYILTNVPQCWVLC